MLFHPFSSWVICLAFSHRKWYTGIHWWRRGDERVGGYNNLINVLESMLIQMEEPIPQLNGGAAWLKAPSICTLVQLSHQFSAGSRRHSSFYTLDKAFPWCTWFTMWKTAYLSWHVCVKFSPRSREILLFGAFSLILESVPAVRYCRVLVAYFPHKS